MNQNHTNKIIQTFVTGIPLFLLSESIAVAQDLPDFDLKPDLDDLMAMRSRRAKDLVMTNFQVSPVEAKSQTSTSSQLLQSLTFKPQSTILAKSNLNSGNFSIQLPSQSQDVEIQDNQPLSLQKTLKLAIENNPEVREARLNLVRSQQELREARADIFPTLGTDLLFSNETDPDSARSLDIARLEQGGSFDRDINTSFFDGSLSLSYNLYTGGFRKANIQRAKEQVRFNQLDLERIIFDIKFETVDNYYSLQNTDSQVKIEQAAVNDAQQTLQDAKLLTQAGIGTNFDVIRAEVELANARQNLTTAKAEQSAARRQLAATLSVEERVEITTADPIQPAGNWQLSLEEAIIEAYKNRPELQQLLVQREINQKQKQISLAAIRPQVSLNASYEVLDVADDNVNLTDGYTLYGLISWDFFDGGAAESLAKQSQTDIEINEAQFVSQRNLVRLEVEQGYFALTASQENIKTSQAAEKLATESLELARLRFNSGVGTQADVIEAQSDLTNARANNIQAIINYNKSLNQLERAVTIVAKY